ncbi:MAG: exodeoxyribonuclease VII large subunit [Candidatus Limiplasma sp.]|nr:exodeoxyribonuclease VII large subunit [Candidatus Limiplasma sp.]
MSRTSLTLTVAELNEYVRRSLASDPMLHGLCLRGEISNLKRHVSGHWYFTLKDSQSAISCAMFRQAAMTVAFAPMDGQQVRLFGSVGLYAKTGQYQFYADAMEQDGVGEMYARYERLKQKLSQEGLFDPSLKKPLPLLPRGVGIVTSKTGAVIHDITRVAWRRNPGMPLFLCPVQVQGEGAAQEIVQGIRAMDQLPQVDVIILGRGGGSIEDLWAFNEEAVARAIFACQKPVVSAVGHETDVTIADFVADLRAPTPSAAAEMVVQPREALLEEIAQYAARLERACQFGLQDRQMALAALGQRLSEASPQRQLQLITSRVEQALQRLDNAAQGILIQRGHALAQSETKLRAAGPAATIARGYAMVLKGEELLETVEDAPQGTDIRVVMRDGELRATVRQMRKEEGLWQGR